MLENQPKGSRLDRLGAAAVQYHQDRDRVALDALTQAALEFATSEEVDAQ